MKCPKCNAVFVIENPYRYMQQEEEEIVTDDEIKYLQKLQKQLSYLEKKNEILRPEKSSSHFSSPYSSTIVSLGIILCIVPVIVSIIITTRGNDNYKSWCYIATYEYISNEKNKFLLYRYHPSNPHNFIGSYNSVQEAKEAAENLSCNLK